MSWHRIIHSRCVLPGPFEILKQNVQTSSLYECDAQGCNKIWAYMGKSRHEDGRERIEWVFMGALNGLPPGDNGDTTQFIPAKLSMS